MHLQAMFNNKFCGLMKAHLNDICRICVIIIIKETLLFHRLSTLELDEPISQSSKGF